MPQPRGSALLLAACCLLLLWPTALVPVDSHGSSGGLPVSTVGSNSGRGLDLPADAAGFVLVLASNSTAAEQHAAAQVVSILGAALGASVPTVPTCGQQRGAGAGAGAGPAPQPRCLGIGRGAALELGMQATDLAALGAEGYAISSNLSVPGALAASGGVGSERGSSYAATALLKHLGWRFYAPDETHTPDHAEIVAAATVPIEERRTPALIWRSVESYETNGADPHQTPPTGTAAQMDANYVWSLRQHNNGHDGVNCGGKCGSFPMWAGASAHTSYTLLGETGAARSPPLAVWTSHREWFWPRTDPKAYGQLCWTNASLLSFITDKVQTMLRANPTATMVSLSQNDNLNQCMDAEEKAVVKAEGSASGPMIRACNHVAAAIAAVFPGVLIHTLAYDYTEQPPSVTKPLPNVVVQVASSGIGDPRIEAWGKICRQIFVWDYWANFKHFVQPYPNYYHLGPNIQWYHANGVSGMYEEGNGWGSGGELDALKAFLIEEMMYDPTQSPDVLITEFLAAYYTEGAVFVEQYMQTMHQALLDAAPYKLTNTDHPTAPFLSSEALLTSISLLKEGAAAVTTELRRQRMETTQLAVYYPVLLRWNELRAFARNASLTWPLEPMADAALATFVKIATAINLTHLMEPDSNSLPHGVTHDLNWLTKQVHCNCSWAETCCQEQKCCGHSPPPPAPPSPPAPPAPGTHMINIKPLAEPSIINATARVVGPRNMAHFAQTLYRFPGGQLFTNFQTVCDVCVPHRTYAGRSFSSADNGSSWKEILPIGDANDPYTNGAQVWKTCMPGNDPSWNSLTCFAYPLHISDPNNNRTGSLLMSRFEVIYGRGVRQVSVVNATMDWPEPGLIPFAVSASPGNWFMVADAVPLRANSGNSSWLMPMYGTWKEPLLPPNTTHQNQNQNETSNVLALVRNTDASLTKWELMSWVNTGQPWQCAPSRGAYWPLTPHSLCNPTESAMVRLANGDLLIVWRNDPGYNVTIMAQVSTDDGLTFSLAAPMHGKITDGSYEDIVDAPFGVEPKLQMMSSGVIVLSTGRPRMYLWALAPGADPLTAAWQPFDQGKIHNAAVAMSGSPSATPAGVMSFTPSYWKIWRGASDPKLRGTGCCMDAYTGIVALPDSDVLVMTYDMLAFNCPKGVYSSNNVCDFIVSMQLEVTTNSTPAPPQPPAPPPPPSPPAPDPSKSGISNLGAPTVIVSQPHKLAPTGMAKFAQTLFRFPGGQLFTNFETSCDVCVPKRTYPGRSFASADNGSSWKEISPFGDPADPFTNGAQVFKSCVPVADGANALLCNGYLLSISDPVNNRTANMLISRFEVGSGGGVVTQMSVHNATVGGWPEPGLVPFQAKDAPGNYYMVQDGSPIETRTKGEFLMPVYGLWQAYEICTAINNCSNSTQGNAQEPVAVIALLKNTDASMSTWTFHAWVNTGVNTGPGQGPRDPHGQGTTHLTGGCAPSRGAYWPATDHHNTCNPTETATVRLKDGRMLMVWRNDPGFNLTLMAQISNSDGVAWSAPAVPMDGAPVSPGAPGEVLVSGPFGVEPRLLLMDSGVLLLLSGRPRIYLWALPAGADPLKDTWYPYDLGKIHNAAIAGNAGATNATKTLPGRFPPRFWTTWRGEKGGSLMCCTDAYTGMVAVSATEAVVTYDMLATTCPGGAPGDCDTIISMKLSVATNGEHLRVGSASEAL